MSCSSHDIFCYNMPYVIAAYIEELYEGRHIKTGERREVVDLASQKRLPRIR
jgi:hypothetical protein